MAGPHCPPECYHRTPHEHDGCDIASGYCGDVGYPTHCIPIAKPDANYRAMWCRLQQEMADLRLKGVRQIDPAVVQRFMGYIQEAASAPR
jgi:hypothetical protein